MDHFIVAAVYDHRVNFGAHRAPLQIGGIRGIRGSVQPVSIKPFVTFPAALVNFAQTTWCLIVFSPMRLE